MKLINYCLPEVSVRSRYLVEVVQVLIRAIAVLFEVYVQFGGCAQDPAIFYPFKFAHCKNDPLSICTWSKFAGVEHNMMGSGTYSCGKWAATQLNGGPYRSWRCLLTAQHKKCCTQR